MKRRTVFRSGNKVGLELTRIFVKVVERGSFSRAAETLRLPKSTVSKSIARLERELDVKLLVRTTRAVAPTAAGRAYFDQCAGPIEALDLAHKSIASRDREVSGHLRITAPEDYGAHVVSPAIAELVVHYPGLSFEVRYTDEVVDLVRDGFDLAIRLGKLKASRLYARRLGESSLIAVASPAYLEQAPPLLRPADLLNHACLSITAGAADWTLLGPRGRVRVPVQSRILCNQMSSLVQMATRGAGVALVPSFLCRAEIEAGQLVRALPAWGRPGMQVSLAAPLPSSASARLKVVMDHLSAAIPRALSA
ncbi:MAG: LysR family transcriptional regulator [Polyangiaceae bacterium]|nr:LysR family transcriptional regulator [Polyangiaceae bacterium]